MIPPAQWSFLRTWRREGRLSTHCRPRSR
jgi:hypothetical protein